MSSLVAITFVITSAINAGIGNSIAMENVNKNYHDLNKFNFIYMWFSGWCSICLMALYQPFMKLWVGEEMMLSNGFVILLVLYFYALKMGDIRSCYVEGTGMFWEGRYRAIAETVSNIVLNWTLVKLWGLYGIVTATLLSILIFNFGYGSQIIFHYYFKNNKLWEYFKLSMLYFAVTSFIGAFTYVICSFISDEIYGIIIRLVICIVVPNIIYIMIYRKSTYMEESVILLRHIIPSKVYLLLIRLVSK